MSAVGRIGGVGRLGLVAAAVRQLFDPRSLFTAGDQGVWYDPFDLSTLFQDSAGTTPVTAVEQPVGLMLDKSRGLVLGPELVVNGDFSEGIAGWVAGSGGAIAADSTIFSSGIRVTGGGSELTAGAQQVISGFVVGRRYRVSAAAYAAPGNSTPRSAVISLFKAPQASQPDLSAQVTSSGVIQTLSFVFTASATSHTIYGFVLNRGVAWADANSYAYFDNISVRELPGAHATQPTATARPAYRANPQRVNFDGVDDVHTTTFPFSLGSNCTIARAIPGVGASILTAQTVGTTFNNTISHAGMLIIDRALNATETARLTAYLNAKAGV